MSSDKENKETKEHILVCLSTAPSNEGVIRTAAGLAAAIHARFTALFVKTPDFDAAVEEDRNRLTKHRQLAERLGASVETVYGSDVPYQIAEYARLSGVTRLVLGRTVWQGRNRIGKAPMSRKLLEYLPDMEIHIIPDRGKNSVYYPQKIRKKDWAQILSNWLKSIAILSGATVLSLIFDYWKFTDANIIMIYILGVVMTSVATSQRLYSLVSSVGSVVIFNFLFTEPRYSLTAYGAGYPITFLAMFGTAYVTGTLALRYKEQASQAAKNAYRTKVLLDTDRLLATASDKDEIFDQAGRQLVKLLRRDVMIYENVEGVLSDPHVFYYNKKNLSPVDLKKEMETVYWVMSNNHAAGAGTDIWPDAKYYYLAIRLNDRVYGVAGISANEALPEAEEQGMMLSILGETALVLENEKIIHEKEAAAILAESEQMRANLLRSISHDLRTPLTSISGNADNLLWNGDRFDLETRRRIYKDIYDDSIWLINLVENLLYATRIENGKMSLSTEPQLVSEIIGGAVHHLKHQMDQHELKVCCDDDLLMVRADARLMVQVLVNLVDNAVKYTPKGSEITITGEKRDGKAVIFVADEGVGISDDEKEKVFEKFYCAGVKIADNRRSIGLGLYLCRAIVEAHGGTICVTDNKPHGAIFCITLPLEEVPLYE